MTALCKHCGEPIEPRDGHPGKWLHTEYRRDPSRPSCVGWEPEPANNRFQRLGATSGRIENAPPCFEEVERIVLLEFE